MRKRWMQTVEPVVQEQAEENKNEMAETKTLRSIYLDKRLLFTA